MLLWSVGRPQQTHIGVASGQVVASGTGSDTHQEYTVIGDSVDLASRLQDKAEAGQTLVSQAAYAAVSDLVDCQPIGEIAIKGFETPVRPGSSRRSRRPAWRPARAKRTYCAARPSMWASRRP